MDLDLKKSRLFEDHTNMKSQLDGLKRWSLIPFENEACVCDEQHGNYTHYRGGGEDEEEECDDDDDFEYEETASDDEAVVFVAEMMLIRGLPPGSVKLVYIPPRESNKPTTGSSTTESIQPDAPRLVHLKEVPKQKKGREARATEAETRPGEVRWQNTLPVPRTPGSRHPRALSKLDTQSLARYPQSHQLSPSSPYRSPTLAHVQYRKARLPKEHSRNLVTGWIDSDSSTASRPLSWKVDPDVLADQNLDRPPTPPPKDPRRKAGSTPGEFKHHCVRNGHVFDRIDLEQVSDDTALNRLEINPYLQTPTGVREAVKIPVICENCGEKCDSVLWRCSIQARRIVVCDTCQQGREKERRVLAEDSWKR